MGRKDTYLTEKYKRLYGAMDCSEEVNKARREMRLKYAAVCILFALLIGAGQASQNSMEKELIKNAQGALISVNRPESGAQPLIFTADAAVKTKEGIVEKQVQVTIEPYNSGKEKKKRQEVPAGLTEEQKLDRRLRQSMEQLNQNTAVRCVNLPAETEKGEALQWRVSRDSQLPLYFIGMMMALYFVYRSRYSKIHKEEAEAKASIIKELPEFTNKLILLLNAGAVPNTAFIKIVEDRKKMSAPETYFYRQMDMIFRSMNSANGVMQEEFRDFAKRSGVRELIRIANIISDNMKKGTDLAEKLQRENELLWFSRKQQAEEQGKLAETKMTMPLMILLMVLVMVTIAPAMMEM